MSKADRAMGDIDSASSPQSQNAPQDPGVILGSIDLATHGGMNSTKMVSMAEQCPGSTVAMDQGCGDQIELELKMGKAEQLALRNKAFNAGQMQNTDPMVPDYQAGEVEY